MDFEIFFFLISTARLRLTRDRIQILRFSAMRRSTKPKCSKMITLRRILSLFPRRLRLMVFFQPQPQLSRVFIVALFTNRLQIHLVEFSFDRYLLVAGGTREMVDTPGLVESREDIGLYDLIANHA